MLVAVVVATAALPLASSSAQQSLSQLNSSLGATQSRVNTLTASLHSLDSLISSLTGQISLVQSREAAVRVELQGDESRLAKVMSALRRERGLLAQLEKRLARARVILSHQLVSNYEQGSPDLMTVVLGARGFTDLLDKLNYLKTAEHQQQSLITLTSEAKAAATKVEHQLTGLTATDRRITQTAQLRERALAGMNELLSSKQTALQHARAAQATALASAKAHGSALRSAIAKVQAAQAAAEAAQQGSSSTSSASYGPALGPSGGWAIPYAIVLCESGGQDLPPNSAGASGYYQIIPSTWRLFDGTGPAAYLASKSEQDAVASRIWNGGAGASNWVCAGIVGIH